jgi:acyl-CoA synthetase (AMP-forming)/AMP-acid ligase II
MTETFGPYCADPLDRDLPPEKYGSLGRPFPGIEVEIGDPETGTPVPTGEIGEIRLRGPNLMRGICGRTRAETFTADGYYPTGDSGRLDNDGYLYFTGRLDDMFKVHGANVYPSEVEAALEAEREPRLHELHAEEPASVTVTCARPTVSPAPRPAGRSGGRR